MPEPWYQEGLRFSCTRCGHCCTGEPGFVWIDDLELQMIADARSEPVEEVAALYTRLANARRTLREKANGDCVFLTESRGCSIYEVRPKQCRTWPFWESNVATPADWDRAQRVCPGAGRGELIPVEEITRRVRVIRI